MSDWTDDRIEQLKKLYAEGLSSSQIGAILGVSRNAVIGKVHRLRLERRGIRIPHERRPVSERQPKKPKAAPVVKIKRSPPLGPLPEPFIPRDNPDHTFLHVSVLELNDTICKWPSGNRNFTFCGQPTFDPYKIRRYCPSHHALSLRCTEAA